MAKEKKQHTILWSQSAWHRNWYPAGYNPFYCLWMGGKYSPQLRNQVFVCLHPLFPGQSSVF